MWEGTIMMEQYETKMHVYPTNLRVETQVAGALLPQSYDKHWITLRIQISICRQKYSLKTVPTIPKWNTALLVSSNSLLHTSSLVPTELLKWEFPAGRRTLGKENKYLGGQEMRECSVTAWVAWRRGKGNCNPLSCATKARQYHTEPGDSKFKTSHGDALSYCVPLNCETPCSKSGCLSSACIQKI